METTANPAEETAVLTPEQIADLKTRAAKADENWERLLRTTADFDNFKKRAAREKIEAGQYATSSLLQKVLPVLDNFRDRRWPPRRMRRRREASLPSSPAWR